MKRYCNSRRYYEFFEPRRSIAASSLARPNRIIRPVDGSSLARPNRIIRPVDGSRVVRSLIAHPLAADSDLAGTNLPRFDQERERDASKIPDLDAVRRRSDQRAEAGLCISRCGLLDGSARR
jgi:hypothetical protein